MTIYIRSISGNDIYFKISNFLKIIFITIIKPIAAAALAFLPVLFMTLIKHYRELRNRTILGADTLLLWTIKMKNELTVH